MAPPLMSISDMGVNLGDRWLLRGVDLSVSAGDRLALVGRNGAGKSTLFKMITGKEAPKKVLEYAQMVGMVLLLSLVLYANFNDLYRWLF